MISILQYNTLILLLLAITLSGCQSVHYPKSTANLKYKQAKRISELQDVYKGCYKIGKPYKIKRKKYYPKYYNKYASIGIASWYGGNDGFHGKKTANGDIFDKNLLTAAHKTLPLPSMIKVTNLENNKTAILMVNDRGPFYANRLLDVSERAAEILGFKNNGTAKVKMVYLKKETDKLLDKLGLSRIEGRYANRSIKNPACSVDCYIKMANMRSNISPYTNIAMVTNAKNENIKRAKEKKVSTKLELVKNQYKEEIDSVFNIPNAYKGKSSTASTQKLVTPINLTQNNYFIMVGNFKSVSQTKNILPKLRKLGATRVAKVNNNFHIKLGPINSLSKAREVAVKVANLTGVNTKIIKINHKV